MYDPKALEKITNTKAEACDFFQADAGLHTECVTNQKGKKKILLILFALLIVSIVLFLIPFFSTDPYPDVTVMYIGIALAAISIGIFFILISKYQQKGIEFSEAMEQTITSLQSKQ